ncbi:MAG: aminodeoxychorismate/anthranilate synthase component II [Cyanobacteria bacterium J06627_3]
MILVIDNYDSFTYNLVQYLGELGHTLAVASDVQVFRNDQISLEQIRTLAPAGILISPGPGTPNDAGISLELIKELGPTVPILGVCLGHQSIGQVFGGTVTAASELMHGKTSPVIHTQQGVFAGLENPLTATRYHSLIVERDSCPQCLEITAWLEDGTIMGLRHRQYPHIQGVQFHPESVLTQSGKQLLHNFLSAIPSRVSVAA